MREISKNSTAGCDDDLLFYNKWKQQPKKNNLLNLRCQNSLKNYLKEMLLFDI